MATQCYSVTQRPHRERLARVKAARWEIQRPFVWDTSETVTCWTPRSAMPSAIILIARRNPTVKPQDQLTVSARERILTDRQQRVTALAPCSRRVIVENVDGKRRLSCL